MRLHAQAVRGALGDDRLPRVIGSVQVGGVALHVAVDRRASGNCYASGVDAARVGILGGRAGYVDGGIPLKSVVAMPRQVADIAGCNRPGFGELPLQRQTEVLVVHRPEGATQTFQAGGQDECRRTWIRRVRERIRNVLIRIGQRSRVVDGDRQREGLRAMDHRFRNERIVRDSVSAAK